MTSAGGAVRASDRHATAYLFGVDGGPPRFEGFGRELRRTASGISLGLPPSASSSGVRAQFLRDTRVGRMPGLALFGVQEGESELEEIELVAQEEGSGSESEEDGPGPP